MGGQGSGRWRDHVKAQVVEDCLFLDTAMLRRDGLLDGCFVEGTFTWTSSSGKVVGSARYSLEHSADGTLLRLVFCVEAQYRLGVVENQVKLERTRPHYGGQRWWFLCPICGTLARRLFLPPNESGFGCRRCRHLTYRSCQESHTTAGFFHRLQRLGLLPSLGKP